MKLSNKMIFGALGIVLFTMILSTAITLFMIYRQNLAQAEDLLDQSIGIIQDDISLTDKQLRTNSHQISIAADMGSKIKYMEEQKVEGADINNVQGTVREMIKSVYDITVTGNLWKVAIYDNKGELTAFVIKEGEQSLMGFPYLDLGISTATLKTGAELVLLDDEIWKKQSAFSEFDLNFKGSIPTEEIVQYEIVNGFLSLVSYTPVKVEEYDFDSGETVRKQTGFVIAYHQFGNGFVDRISNLSRTNINIFNSEGLSSGKLTNYNKLDLSLFPKISSSWNIAEQRVTFNQIDLNDKSYFQAILPIYLNTDCIGAITSLYSTEIAQSNTWQIFRLLCLILVGCVIIITPIAFFFARSLSKPLVRLNSVLDDIEHTGDFSKRAHIKTKDEIGKTGYAFDKLMDALQSAINDLNSVLNNVAESNLSKRIIDDFKGDLGTLKERTNRSIDMLSQTISQVIEASENVESSSVELNNSSQLLADGTSKQAASLEEISSSMNEISANTKANSDNATQAQQLTSTALDIVQRGDSQMQEMLSSMQEINDTTANVSKIIKVIDDIAFQTNLLALNAAVEAARAGKYGKGFAVVADEVRNLASRSADAAKNTTNLIQKATQEVQKGVNNAGKTADILGEISTSVVKVNDMIGEIAIASRHQTEGIVEIEKGLSLMNDVVQQNSSISEETASSSVELSGEANRMQQMMQKFILKEQSQSESEQPLLENPYEQKLITE